MREDTVVKKTNSDEKNKQTTGRDAKGRFRKGFTANPGGRGSFINALIDALKNEGQKRGEDFWQMVAQRVWTNDVVLIAVLKKILPDKIQGEGFGDTKIILVTPKERKENASRIDSITI